MEGVCPCGEYAGAPRRLARGAQLSAAQHSAADRDEDVLVLTTSSRSFSAAARGASADGAVLLLPLPAAGGFPAAASPSQRALHAGGGLRTATAAVSRRCLRCAPPAALRRGVLGKKLECMCVFRHPGWAGKSEEGVVMESLRGGRGGAQRAAQCAHTGAETGQSCMLVADPWVREQFALGRAAGVDSCMGVLV